MLLCINSALKQSQKLYDFFLNICGGVFNISYCLSSTQVYYMMSSHAWFPSPKAPEGAEEGFEHFL